MVDYDNYRCKNMIFKSMITKSNAEMISAFSIHLTPVKTWNRVYKFWGRPELQHDWIKCPNNCITATTCDITSWTLNRLKYVKYLSLFSYTKVLDTLLQEFYLSANNLQEAPLVPEELQSGHVFLAILPEPIAMRNAPHPLI